MYKINGFDNILWAGAEHMPEDVFIKSGLDKKSTDAQGLLVSRLESGDLLIAVKSQIGKEAHPMIKIAGCTSWHTGDDGGYYVTGFDMKKREFFQIIP